MFQREVNEERLNEMRSDLNYYRRMVGLAYILLFIFVTTVCLISDREINSLNSKITMIQLESEERRL